MPFQAAAGNEGFDTAARAAIAGRPGRVDDHVAPFTGDTLRAGAHAAVQDDAAAAACPHDDAEYAVVAAPGALQGLGEGEAVGVVLDAHRVVQRRLEHRV